MSQPDHFIIDITEENLDEQNIFCQQSKKKEEGYQAKVAWFRERLQEGMKLKILNVYEGKRGYKTRGFIEYIPSEFTWRGIKAEDYMVIHCIWVVGQNKGKGYGTKLLKECMQDAKGMNGVAVVTNKKGHWLPNPKLFKKHGFKVVDIVYDTQELWVKKFNESAPEPRFFPLARKSEYEKGFTVLTSDQCPYNPAAAKLVKIFAEKRDLPFRLIKLKTAKEAQENGYTPFGTFCIIFNGEYLSYYFQNEKGLTELLAAKGINY